MNWNAVWKIIKENAKYAVDQAYITPWDKHMAKFFVDGCDTPYELAWVMAAVSWRQQFCLTAC